MNQDAVIIANGLFRTSGVKTSLVLPPLIEAVELIRLLGAEACAVALHEGGIDSARREETRERLSEELQVPVLLPSTDGLAPVVDHVETLPHRRRLE